MDRTDLKSLPTETVSDVSDSISFSPTDLSALPTSHPSSMLIIDRHLQHAAFYNRKPTLLRLDVLPFLLLYLLLLTLALPALHYELTRPSAEPLTPITAPTPLLSLIKNDTTDDDLLSASSSFDDDPLPQPLAPALPPPPPLLHFIALYLLPLLSLLHLITFLSAYWYIKFNTFLRYSSPSASPLSSQFIRIIPLPHCGAPALCPLERGPIDGVDAVHFTFQKTKFLYQPPSPTNPACFIPLSYPTSMRLSEYLGWTGLDGGAVRGAVAKFGLNVFDIPLPAFMELFIEHAMAPFFLFQILCVLLWCLDEYWYYSLMTLFMLVSFEATVVKRRLKHLEYVRDMRVPPFKLYVHRDHRWQEKMSNEIVPGDLVSMTRTVGDSVCPCDVLIVSGQAVVNEALLTGESVPQVKEAVDLNEGDVALNLSKQHKRHVLYGGTKILLTSHKESAEAAKAAVKPAPDGGCVCFALHTGFSSGQGKLVRTILYSTERVSVNNTESLLFILFLLVFAIMASAYVLYHGLQDEGRSRYRLILNCVMIITSVVPPELPMELSLAVNTSLMQLAQLQVFCTEPFRIPLAGAIDICCFDKTGTLTADVFKVSGIAGVGGERLQDAKAVSDEVKWVIAGCHSLAHIADAGLVGDPLEKAAFTAIGWTYNKADVAVSEAGKQRIRLVQRFAFTSTLKRMSCIIALDHDGNAPLRVVVKGAAEVMEGMFSDLPSYYTDCHQSYARQGCRVLALGYRVLPLRDDPTGRKTVREMKREAVETGLTFAGFLVLQCPLKPDSIDVVRHLMDSSHAVVMITGDNTLTACSVARQLTIITQDALILSHTPEGDVAWVDVDNRRVADFDRTFSVAVLHTLASAYDLCASGEAIEYLMQHERVTAAQVGVLIPFVRVFARTSPDQKELILTRLKLAGRVTLMCGDGTNDVGALKQAHIGVALIGEDTSEKTREDAKEGEEKKSAVAPALSLKPAPQLSKFQQALQMTKRVQQEQTVAERTSGRQWSSSERSAWIKRRFTSEMQAMQAQALADEPPPIRLGDASIASPFTSKVPYITSTLHIIRQGRCTLVTTLQMFAILGVNRRGDTHTHHTTPHCTHPQLFELPLTSLPVVPDSLISAYSMSVLYLDGVKMGDAQMTFAGLSIAMFFLFISRSKPVDRLSAERPPSRLFTWHMMLAVVGQFALHMLTLLTAVQLSTPHTPQDAETKSPDSTFKPNVLNTVVYLVSTISTTSTFLANYRGRPFMQGLRENKWLWRALMVNVGVVLLLASGLAPELNELMQLVEMPSAVLRMQLMGLVVFDLLSTIAYANLLKRVFAIKPKRTQAGRTAAAGRLKAE